MNILLVCVAGMSTSLLVRKMEIEATSRGLEVKIAAKAFDNLENVIDDYDVILIGPQIKYKEPYIKKLAEQKGKKYAVIPSIGYFGVAEPPIRSLLSRSLAQNEPPCCWVSH